LVSSESQLNFLTFAFFVSGLYSIPFEVNILGMHALHDTLDACLLLKYKHNFVTSFSSLERDRITEFNRTEEQNEV